MTALARSIRTWGKTRMGIWGGVLNPITDKSKDQRLKTTNLGPHNLGMMHL